jgi:hypothetical protein
VNLVFKEKISSNIDKTVFSFLSESETHNNGMAFHSVAVVFNNFHQNLCNKVHKFGFSQINPMLLMAVSINEYSHYWHIMFLYFGS